MQTNALPRYDMSDNPTGCCPRFKPEGWDGQQLHFREKLFVRATTRSLFHIPLNMGSVYPQTLKAIEDADAVAPEQLIVLSHDPSPWRGEHLFAVSKEVAGQEMVRLSGEFVTRVFEGPYRNAPQWENELEAYVASQGKELKKSYFFLHDLPQVREVLRQELCGGRGGGAINSRPSLHG